MKEEITNRKGSVLMPVLVGSAVGAGLALLFATKAGTEIRKDLTRAANRFSQVVGIGKDLYGESKEFVTNAVQASKKAYVEEKPLELVSRKERSLILPVLASGIIGAGIALLLAPKSGAETRKDLRRFASDTGDRVASAIDKGKDLYERSTAALSAAAEAGKKEYVEGSAKFEHAA